MTLKGLHPPERRCESEPPAHAGNRGDYGTVKSGLRRTVEVVHPLRGIIGLPKIRQNQPPPKSEGFATFTYSVGSVPRTKFEGERVKGGRGDPRKRVGRRDPPPKVAQCPRHSQTIGLYGVAEQVHPVEDGQILRIPKTALKPLRGLRPKIGEMRPIGDRMETRLRQNHTPTECRSGAA